MTIEWNKVTWYSKLLAVILFVLTFVIAFNLGEQKAKLSQNLDQSNGAMDANQKPATDKTTPVSITKKTIKEENFSGTMPEISGSSIAVLEAQKYINAKIAEFRTQANTDVPDMREKFGIDSPPANYTIDIDATYVKGSKTESIVISIYAYTGGANGNSSYKVITASLVDGKTPARILSLSDIIDGSKQDGFTEFVKTQLDNWQPSGSTAPVVFTDDVKDLKFNSFVNWSVDDKNLTVYFDKYQIGPGVLGAVAFPLPLEKIKDFTAASPFI